MSKTLVRVAAVSCVLCLVSASAGAGEWTSADASAVASYRLDMAKVTRWVEASQGISRALHGDPALKARLRDEQGDNDSIAVMAARLEAVPAVGSAIRQAGLDGRQYVLIMLTLVQASLVAALLDDDPDARVPGELNPANLEFVRTHRAELEAMRELLAPPHVGLADDEDQP